MFEENRATVSQEIIVTYAPRAEVLTHLLRLIQDTLTPHAMSLLLAYCGYPDNRPRTARELARLFALSGGAPQAERTIREIIDTVRRAIPASPVAGHLCGFSAFVARKSSKAFDNRSSLCYTEIINSRKGR